MIGFLPIEGRQSNALFFRQPWRWDRVIVPVAEAPFTVAWFMYGDKRAALYLTLAGQFHGRSRRCYRAALARVQAGH
jgi:hypothetical protein